MEPSKVPAMLLMEQSYWLEVALTPHSIYHHKEESLQ
jgi:hypothetical protein